MHGVLVRTNVTCPLCNLGNVASLKHIIVDCPILKPKRSYVTKYLDNVSDDASLMIKLNQYTNSNDFVMNMYKYWIYVTNTYELLM